MKQRDDVIPKILERYHTIAVVGLSAKSNRASHGVSSYMQQHGYRIIPVNPAYAGTKILGEHCYATLEAAATALNKDGLKIELVNCFRQADAIMPIAEDAIEIGARIPWRQSFEQCQIGLVDSAIGVNIAGQLHQSQWRLG